jgi:hypothetical protein
MKLSKKASDESIEYPLHKACAINDAHQVSMLLDKKLDVNQKNDGENRI